jgi:ketosteroid isomerase-like protein
MIKTIVFIAVSVSVSILFIGCHQENGNNYYHLEQLKLQIGETERAMCDLATKEGFNAAILYYADPYIVKFRDGKYPIKGKDEFATSFTKENDVKTITWEPFSIDVAKSGDIGYSWGNWKYVLRDTTMYGNYFTVWKKQADGTWKVALDGGGSTPKPKN